MPILSFQGGNLWHDNAVAQSLLTSLRGLAFGDKGYIGKKLFEVLFENGLKLITRKRKNMKEQLNISAYEHQLLNQRSIIETIFNCLKHKYHIWHTRHRSVRICEIFFMCSDSSLGNSE